MGWGRGEWASGGGTHWNWFQNSKPHRSCKHIRLKLHFRRGLTKGFGARDSRTAAGHGGPTSKPGNNSPGGGVRSCWPSPQWKLSQVTRMPIQKEFSEVPAALLIKSQSHLLTPKPVHLSLPRLVTCVQLTLQECIGWSRLALCPGGRTRSSSPAWAGVKTADVPPSRLQVASWLLGRSERGSPGWSEGPRLACFYPTFIPRAFESSLF